MTPTVLRLVTNELEKMLRHRWVLMVIPYGLAIIGFAIYLGYITIHLGVQLGPHPVPDWRSTLRNDNVTIAAVIANDEQQKAQFTNRPNGALVIQQLDRQIAQLQTRAENNQYHLDHDAPPPEDDLITQATAVSLDFGMFILTLVIGWLASELIAEERANRTMTLLLARPISRTQLMAAKALTGVAVGFVLVVIAVLLGYVFSVINAGNFGDPTTNVIILKDGSQPLSDGNAVVLPALALLGLELAVSLLSVICLVGMAMLLSSLLRSAGVAIAITLGFLFMVPPIVTTIAGAATALGTDAVANVVKYLWFTNFEPANVLVNFSNAGVGTSSAVQGLNVLGTSVPVLLAWSVAFYGLTWWLLTRRDET